MQDKLQFYSHRIFHENNRIYVYCINNTGLFEIDDRTKKLIEQEGKSYEEAYIAVKEMFTREEFLNLINAMKDNYFVVTKENDEIVEAGKQVEPSEHILSLTLLLAQECNLRCTYCYAEDGEYYDKGIMSPETATKAIDFLIAQSGDYDKLSVVLFGGEPLMAMPTIKELVPYIREYEKKTGKKININMTTNGTLITQEIEDYLIKNQIGVQISIDGDKETHDHNRFYANKNGSYDSVLSHTENMRRKKLLSARATLTGKQLNLRHTFEHLDQLNFRSIAIAPASNLLSEEDFENLIQEEIDFIHYFESLVKAKEYEKASKMKMVVGNLRRIHTGGMRNLPCGVGRNMYAVDIHGDLYPCHRFVNSKEFVLGSVNNNANKRNEFIDDIKLSNHSQCSSCWAQNLCLGHCPHENFTLTGSTTMPFEKVCSITRAKFDELVHMYLRLTPNEKDIIFSSSNHNPVKKDESLKQTVSV